MYERRESNQLTSKSSKCNRLYYKVDSKQIVLVITSLVLRIKTFKQQILKILKKAFGRNRGIDTHAKPIGWPKIETLYRTVNKGC